MIPTLATLVLATLVAQAVTPTPATMPSPGPSMPGAQPGSTPSAGGPASTAMPSDDYVRRGPGSAPRVTGPRPSANAGDATIVDSGSTNIGGYTVVVHPDYSADVSASGTTEHKTVGAPQARWLFAKLRAAMPLGNLPAGRCMKSASFGSSTTIAYDGQTTPDLTCVGDPTSRELARTVNVIVEQLHVPVRRGRSIQLR